MNSKTASESFDHLMKVQPFDFFLSVILALAWSLDDTSCSLLQSMQQEFADDLELSKAYLAIMSRAQQEVCVCLSQQTAKQCILIFVLPP